ncbi:MAG: potassium-transporting ATPase subunit KdpC [Bdellovibrionales bacterium]|nr:potassium-transporting ATPase subunit KdpC [Bdellovibrionales bacterium]
MKQIIPAIRMLIFMTVLTGVGYPLLVTFVGQVLFNQQANGSMALRGDVRVGSWLVAQNFEGSKYFWPRPSGASFNPLPSSGSNQGQISASLKTTVDERKARLKVAHPEMGEPPQDLLFASGSGLDPDISPEAARYQLSRVAKARGMNQAQVKKLVDKLAKDRQFGFFGEPRVNVLALNLALNLALDESQGIKNSPSGEAPPAGE